MEEQYDDENSRRHNIQYHLPKQPYYPLLPLTIDDDLLMSDLLACVNKQKERRERESIRRYKNVQSTEELGKKVKSQVNTNVYVILTNRLISGSNISYLDPNDHPHANRDGKPYVMAIGQQLVLHVLVDDHFDHVPIVLVTIVH